MKDPMDCTYPHTHLCVYKCDQECRKRNRVTRARREYEEALAEDEAFALAQKHENQKLLLTCNQLGGCQYRQPPCPTCPNKETTR